MQKLENFFYETRPYFFLLVSIITLACSHDDTLRMVSGMILLLTASFIVHSRMQYRNRR